MPDHVVRRVVDRSEEPAGARRPAGAVHGDRDGAGSAASLLLQLQAAAGNRAVAGLVGGSGSPGVPGVQRLSAAPVVVQRQAGLLRAGSRGASVRALQEALNGQGASLAVDGIFGRATRAAVVRYQASAGLTPDGLVGPRTRESLGLGAAGGGAAGGAGHQVELGHQIAEAVGHQVSGGAGAGGGTTLHGSTVVPGVPGAVASGSVNTATGSAHGEVTAPYGSASGSYNADTGQVSGSASAGAAGVTGSYDTETGSVSGGYWSGGSSASGSYNAETGAVGGTVTTSSGATASGTYDTQSGETSGGFSSASGGTSGSWSANVEQGTGTGTVDTPYGSGTLSVGEDSVHASVDVPGYGSVDVDVPRPDWL